MCFSASASFAASGFLFCIFLLAIRKTKKHSTSMLAYVPLFFALQQAAEGIIWLTAAEQSTPCSFAAYLFLLFAIVWWPAWIPVITLVSEKIAWRRYALIPSTLIGIAAGITGIIALYKGVTPQIMENHVSYLFNLDPAILAYANIYKACYLVAVVLPLFISSLTRIWIIGLSILAAYGASIWWFQNHVLSIWCFFAAIISCLVLVVLNANSHKKQ